MTLFSFLFLWGCQNENPLDNYATKNPEEPTHEQTNENRVLKKYRSFRKKFLPMEEVSSKEALSLLKSKKDDILFLDARTPIEQKVSTLPGALTFKELERQIHLNKNLAKEKTIIVYCTVGYRSAITTKELTKRGFRAKNLMGGVLGWAQENGIFMDSKGEKTNRVHVYGKDWSILPKAYKAVF